MKIAAIIVVAFLGSHVYAQDSSNPDTLFDAISENQSIGQRQKILEKLNLESLARKQFDSGPKFISIAGYALVSPGADHRRVTRDQMIIAPFTGCTPPANTSMEKHVEWTALVSEYALRWNLLMRHFESEQNEKFKPVVSFTEIQTYYRIEDRVFRSLALESKLMMQYTIAQLISEQTRRTELEELLDENGILEPFPQQSKGK